MKSIQDFRENVNLNSKIVVEGREYTVRQIIKFRLDDGDIYYKLFLSDDWILADDMENNYFLFVKRVETNLPIEEKPLIYDNQEFEFLYSAHNVVAEEVWGEGLFTEGDVESFSDYRSDRNYLSLGYDEKTNERMDMFGKIVAMDEVDVKKGK